MKYLITLTLLTSLGFVGRSQTTDTICLPVPQAKKLLIAAQQKRVADSLVILYIEENAVLDKQRSNLAEQVNLLRKIDSNRIAIEAALRNEISLYQSNNKAQAKALRKAQLGKKLTAGAGLLLLIGTVFLLK